MTAKTWLITGANRGIGKGLVTKALLIPNTTVIAAARDIGIAESQTKVIETTPGSMREHFDTNTVGPITLFQAVAPLLKASESKGPIFLAITSVFGSVGAQARLDIFAPSNPYGASKAALNWLVQRIHREEPWLTAFVVHPGLVLTSMGSGIIPGGADPSTFGAISVDTSVDHLTKLILGARREKDGGVFRKYDGRVYPW